MTASQLMAAKSSVMAAFHPVPRPDPRTKSALGSAKPLRLLLWVGQHRIVRDRVDPDDEPVGLVSRPRKAVELVDQLHRLVAQNSAARSAGSGAWRMKDHNR